MTKERKDSSISEDEMFMNNVKEAIDQQFFNDDLYNNEKTKVLQPELKINKPCRKSLRTNSEQEDTFMDSGISATFQNFMAKKLDEILEGTIKLKNKKNIEYLDQEQKKKKNLGIKLLSTSKTFLTTEITEHTEHTECKKKSKREKRKIIEDDNALIKFQEAAIDPEHILSKLDTKAWVNKRPEPDFKYKRLRNGILIEQI